MIGFHQASGYCPGHVAVTDSQFLQASLGQRILGAYYLGKYPWKYCYYTDDNDAFAGGVFYTDNILLNRLSNAVVASGGMGRAAKG